MKTVANYCFATDSIPLASCLQSGDKECALEMHNEILLARENLQGRASYFTLQSYYTVGALCSYLGRHDEAEYVISVTYNCY